MRVSISELLTYMSQAYAAEIREGLDNVNDGGNLRSYRRGQSVAFKEAASIVSGLEQRILVGHARHTPLELQEIVRWASTLPGRSGEDGPAVEAGVLSAVQHRLQEAEKQHGVRVLFACESGSRAWGMPSQTSDYDVRFIYTRPKSYYLQLQASDAPDTLTVALDTTWDIQGWDIQKALRLFAKSNLSLAEWLRSPIVYERRGSLEPALQVLFSEYLQTAKLAKSYHGLARSTWSDISGDTVTAKGYLYVIRSLLLRNWLVQGLPLRVDLPALAATLSEDVKQVVDHMLMARALGPENLTVPYSAVLDRFITKELEAAPPMPQNDATPNMARLDALFVHVLDEVQSF